MCIRDSRRTGVCRCRRSRARAPHGQQAVSYTHLDVYKRQVLSRANDSRTESLKSEDNECILNSAYLEKAYHRVKYLTDENQLDLEGCGFIGLYAGLYGFSVLLSS